MSDRGERHAISTLILLTSDPELEDAARIAAALACYGLVVGHNPEDGVRLFARSLDSLFGVVVDLDSCEHGSAWLTAMTSQSRKMPGLAISRLDPRFVRPLARRHGIDHWLSKPVSSEEMIEAFRALFAEGHLEGSGAGPDVAQVPVSDPFSIASFPWQTGLASGAVKPREFSIHSGTGERCILTEEDAPGGSRRFLDITEAIDYILTLDPPRGSMVTTYDAERMVYRLPI
ncbi:MAG: hypothetical protein P4L99_03225 [Chthoniobacter sp.]|nr:hypothetical protein [Chthoniobacter sp.]